MPSHRSMDTDKEMQRLINAGRSTKCNTCVSFLNIYATYMGLKCVRKYNIGLAENTGLFLAVEKILKTAKDLMKFHTAMLASFSVAHAVLATCKTINNKNNKYNELYTGRTSQRGSIRPLKNAPGLNSAFLRASNNKQIYRSMLHNHMLHFQIITIIRCL